METVARKLDKEHLDSIKSLQEKFTQCTTNIGSLTIELEFLDVQKNSLEQQKANLITQFAELRETETQLIESLKERYGDGQINVTDGLFIPAN